METREADLRGPSHPVTPTDLHASLQPMTPPPSRAAAQVPRTLADRIAEAEREVIAHDEALRHGVERLRDDASETVRSHKRTGLAIGAGAVVLGLLWWKTRHARHSAPVQTVGAHAQAVRPHRQARTGPVVRMLTRLVPLLVPVLAPLLSTRLRQLIGPRTAAMVMAMAMPMVARAASSIAPATGTHGGAAQDPGTVPLLDLQHFAGSWYEVARLPTPPDDDPASRDVSIHYELQGRDQLSVLSHRIHADGSEEILTGVAEQPDPAAPGKLKLSFAPDLVRLLPFAWSDYWVLHVDDDYSHAVVGTPERDHLWLLSRTPRVDDATFHRLASLAAAQGYEVHRLIRTLQTAL